MKIIEKRQLLSKFKILSFNNLEYSMKYKKRTLCCGQKALLNRFRKFANFMKKITQL